MDVFSESISDRSGQVLSGRRVLFLWMAFTVAGSVAPVLVWNFVPKEGAWVPLLFPVPIMVLSAIQWILLRRFVPELSIWAWVISSAIGQVLSYGVSALLGLIYFTSITFFTSLGVLGIFGWSALAEGFGASVIGFTQWCILQRHFKAAHRWVLATFVAGALLSLVRTGLLVTFLQSNLEVAVLGFIDRVIEGILLGGFTGVVLIWFLARGTIGSEPADGAPPEAPLASPVGAVEQQG